MALPKTADVVIIGGGIIGVSMAYYLAQRNVGHIRSIGPVSAIPLSGK